MTKTVKPTQKSVENATNIWNNFMNATLVTGCAAGVILLLMVIFLV